MGNIRRQHLHLQPHAVPEKWRSSSTPRSRSLDNADDGRSGGGGGKNANGGNGVGSNSGNGGKKTGGPNNKGAKAKKRGRVAKASSSAALSSMSLSASTAEKKRRLGAGRSRLESTLLRLRQKLPGKNPLDASYLLESDKRLRKKNFFSKFH